MVAWDDSHYLATLISIDVARPMIAERVVAKKLWAVLFNSLLQCSPINAVEAVLEVKLDRGWHLRIITVSEGIKMIKGKDSRVVGNLNTGCDSTA